MKLDSIVYDYGSLQESIAKALNDESPSFKAIYPSDTATSLVNLFASYGAMVNYQIVSAMANCYTDTAYSEAGIYQLAETLGNRLHGNISSEIHVSIERLNLKGMQNVIIPAGSKFVVGDLNFFNPDAVIFPLSGDIAHNILLIQGTLQTAEYVTSGISNERFYFCDNFKCNTNRVKVFIEDEEWETTDTFLPYVITDESTENETKMVVLKTDPDGRTYIKFGNNTNGIIPSSGSKVKIEYIENEGANGNLNNTDVNIILNTPIFYTTQQNEKIKLEVSVEAVTTASGGFDTQSLDVLRESSPYVFGSGQRAIRRNDYKAMLLNKCGYLTCNVWGEYEEAIINGGYDKIMMNMVYYTGIKSIQQYTAQPMETIDISLDHILVDSSKEYFDIYGNLENARGFFGSYIIELSSYTIDNTPISVKYRDVYGTGILTCDPSININLNNFENDIYPINDWTKDDYVWLNESDNEYYNGNDEITTFNGDNKYQINTNQDEYKNPEDSHYVAEQDPKSLILEDVEYKSSGKRSNQNVVVSFDTPFQIRIDYANPVAISAFSFKRPDDTIDYRRFPHKFAIYATKSNVFTPNLSEYDETMYSNIKNNAKWVKLTGIQTIDNELDEQYPYSDWITTNLYNPDTSSVVEEKINIKTYDSEDYPEGQKIPQGDPNYEEGYYKYKLVEITGITSDYSWMVNLNGETLSATDYTIMPSTTIEGTTYIKFNTSTISTRIYEALNDEANTVLMVNGTVNDWNKYKHYVIEVYELHDSSLPYRLRNQVAISQIKAFYKDRTSTINYTNGNFITLKIPITLDSTNNRRLCLPENMAFYEYYIEASGINQDNGYETGDVLTYQITGDDGNSYTFELTVTNVGKGTFESMLKINDNVATPTLRGKASIEVNEADFTSVKPDLTKPGAKITIESIPTLKMTGTYTGNYYSNSDIQAADLPTINKYNHFTTYLEFKQPRIKNISIEITLEYENVSTYQTVKADVVKAVHSLFDLKPFSIGKTLNISDIWKVINEVTGVKRFIVTNPTNNIDCLPYELINLPMENLIINDTINSEYK